MPGNNFHQNGNNLLTLKQPAGINNIIKASSTCGKEIIFQSLTYHIIIRIFINYSIVNSLGINIQAHILSCQSSKLSFVGAVK